MRTMIPVEGCPGVFTEKLPTNDGPMKVGEIDREIARLSGATAPQDIAKRDQLVETRRANLVQLPDIL